MGDVIKAVGGPIVSAVGSVIGAKSNSNAARDAAKIQAESAAQSLAEQKRIFDLQRSDRAPYLDASQQALGSMGQLAGQSRTMVLPGPSNFGGPMNQAPQGQNYGQLAQVGQQQPAMPPGRPQPMPQPPTQGPPQGMRPQGAPMVMLQAPTGETMQVPADKAQMLMARGARRVG